MFETIRDANLIQERAVYEEKFLDDASVEIEKSLELDYQIEMYLENSQREFIEYDYQEYDYPEYDILDDYYFEEIDRDNIISTCDGFEYVADDENPFDSFDEYDYPEGPNENINGCNYFEQYSIEYHEVDFLDFDEEYPCIIEKGINQETERYIDSLIDEHLKEKRIMEENLEKLIEEYLKEEEKYLNELLTYDYLDDQLIISE